MTQRQIRRRPKRRTPFSRLLTFPNVLVTGHQAFFTVEALTNIATTTIANIVAFERGEGTIHQVTVSAQA